MKSVKPVRIPPWWNTLPVIIFRTTHHILVHKCGEWCICFAEMCPCDWCKYVHSSINARTEKHKPRRVSVMS